MKVRGEGEEGNFHLKGFLAGAIVVFGAVFAWWWFLSDPSVPSVPEKPRRPHGIARSATSNAVASVRKHRKTPNALHAEAKKAEYTEQPVGKAEAVDKDFLKNWVKKPGQLPLANGTVYTFPPPKPGCVATVLVAGHTWECDSEGNFVDTTPASMFNDRFHDLFRGLVANDGSSLLSMCLNFTKDEVAQALITPIQINEDDPPETVRVKEEVAYYKELLKDYIKEGKTYEDFVYEVSEMRDTERQLKVDAVNNLVKFLQDGDVESARLYRDKVEAFLKKNGYYGLKLPENWEEKLAE